MWLFLSSRSLHTSGALVTGVQTGALPIGVRPGLLAVQVGGQDSAHALILSCGMPRSCIANIGTAAKASLTSNSSTSLIDQPVLASSLLIAPTGETVKSYGSCACEACATSFATGFTPWAWATDGRGSPNAAGPPERDALVDGKSVMQ